jgi:uncharacterized protein with PhoU and TrkA domain
VDETSVLCGKTIKESGLRDRDILVLTIQRQNVAIPNPKTSRELVAGDILLCFGKTLTLKGLAPRKKPRKNSGKTKGRS